MELWQMDIVGGVKLVDGSEAKIVSGIDDYSRFVISAQVVERATARPTVAALAMAMRRYGVPDEVLTDNGKVFTGRFGPGDGEVLFDRVCRENGIKHRLTRPRSPTTTGKVERWHKTLRREFLNGKVFADIADAQARLDVWVEHYNHRRAHQSIGMMPPIRRFELARKDLPAPAVKPTVDPAGAMPPAATRKVTAAGKVSFASVVYHVGARYAGETVAFRCWMAWR
jgi:transposase InsO family protein